MTIELKRYVPYKTEEIYKGIRRKDLDKNWKIISLKSDDRDDPSEFNIILQHKETKLKTPMLNIETRHTEDRRGNDKGYMCVYFKNRPTFSCVYGPYTDCVFKAIRMSLRNPTLVMQLFNLKTQKTPYQYCTKKFGPIFDNMRCVEWQLRS
jgi:hypothetical protein